MGPLRDEALDGLLRELGLPAAAAPITPAAALLGQAPAVGLVGWKLAATISLAVGAGFGGGFLAQHDSDDRSMERPALLPIDTDSVHALPTDELICSSLPERPVGSASFSPETSSVAPALVLADGGSPALPVVTERPMAADPSERALPDAFAEIAVLKRPNFDAAPRVRMVASATALGARGGGVPGALVAELTVTGRLNDAGNTLFLGGSLDAGTLLDGGPRLTAALTGLAGFSRETGARRLDVGWALSGRVLDDPTQIQAPGGERMDPGGRRFDGEVLSTGPALALSLGDADSARLRLGLSALVPVGEGPLRTPTLGLSVGADIAPWG